MQVMKVTNLIKGDRRSSTTRREKLLNARRRRFEDSLGREKYVVEEI